MSRVFSTWQDIRTEVLRRIHARIWKPGDTIPNEADLALEFGCARATVNRAMRELADRGIIDRKRKSGTRVNISPVKQATFEISIVRQTIEDMNAVYRYSLVHRSLNQAPAWLRAQLDLEDATQVLHLNCMHYSDNRPFQFEERWINTAAVPSVVDADLTDTGPNEWLLTEIPFSNAEIAFTAVSADSKLSDFLATPTGTPLFQMERTTWFQDTPITFVRMTFHQGYQMSTRY